MESESTNWWPANYFEPEIWPSEPERLHASVIKQVASCASRDWLFTVIMYHINTAFSRLNFKSRIFVKVIYRSRGIEAIYQPEGEARKLIYLKDPGLRYITFTYIIVGEVSKEVFNLPEKRAEMEKFR